jgi:hypothetical protein
MKNKYEKKRKMTEYDVNSVSRANSDGLGCGKNGKSLENRRKK